MIDGRLLLSGVRSWREEIRSIYDFLILLLLSLGFGSIVSEEGYEILRSMILVELYERRRKGGRKIHWVMLMLMIDSSTPEESHRAVDGEPGSARSLAHSSSSWWKK